MNAKPIIAIDGPAASGKGTLSRKIAEALGFAHMDTGALYRAVAWEVLNTGANPENEQDASAGAQSLLNKIAAGTVPAVLLSREELRSDEMAQAASKVAPLAPVRQALIDLQRSFAASPGTAFKGAVLDGRDIGTVICPGADVKLFVTASLEVRAERRLKELQSKGIAATRETVLRDMQTRDERDAQRAAAPMKPAKDAVVLDTSALNPDQALKAALEIIASRLKGQA